MGVNMDTSFTQGDGKFEARLMDLSNRVRLNLAEAMFLRGRGKALHALADKAASEGDYAKANAFLRQVELCIERMEAELEGAEKLSEGLA